MDKYLKAIVVMIWTVITVLSASMGDYQITAVAGFIAAAIGIFVPVEN